MMGRKPKEASKKKVEKLDSLFDKTVQMLRKEYGDKIIQDLKVLKDEPVVGTSTGSIWLDSIICPEAGGMLKGHIIELWGPWSSGKTTIALGLCANATANKEKVIYVDAECALRTSSVINSGVQEDYFHLIRNKDARVVANILEKLIISGEVGLVVIDSVAAWKPLPEQKKNSKEEVDITKSKMALSASFLSETVPHLANACQESGTILVLLNQARVKFTTYGSAGHKPFGGEAVSHWDSVRMRLAGNVVYSTDRISDSDGNILGQYTKCLTDKNKIHRPMLEASVPLFHGIGVNPYMEVSKLAKLTGIIDVAGPWLKWADTGETICQGMDNFAQMLIDDKDLYKEIRSRVIKSLGINYGNRKVVNSFHDENFKSRDLVPVEPLDESELLNNDE